MKRNAIKRSIIYPIAINNWLQYKYFLTDNWRMCTYIKNNKGPSYGGLLIDLIKYSPNIAFCYYKLIKPKTLPLWVSYKYVLTLLLLMLYSSWFTDFSSFAKNKIMFIQQKKYTCTLIWISKVLICTKETISLLLICTFIMSNKFYQQIIFCVF